ncbi:DUF861 domain-containing protein [Mesorhizobium intechi]|uniref:DUF861 domain-containing protein n=1 Tax=Mesorhizobium intechi TaxID=537601 RepID=A0A8T9AYW6_9HYPH|nr:cupin domain-containing protein [Mesorhizobium intechi]TSE13408.1 DUF861 domain-containing protein [Mesorhizobium intechi]
MIGAFALVAGEATLSPQHLDPKTVLAGNPSVSGKTLWTSPDGSQSVGIWQITEGTVTDVEQAELFVVVEGAAEVDLPSGETLRLMPGVVGFFAGGEKTVWRTSQTLRKVYHLLGKAGAAEHQSP